MVSNTVITNTLQSYVKHQSSYCMILSFALLQSYVFISYNPKGPEGSLWNEGHATTTATGERHCAVGFNVFCDFHQASLKQLLPSVLPAINPTIPSHAPAVYSFEWWSRGTLASLLTEELLFSLTCFSRFGILRLKKAYGTTQMNRSVLTKFVQNTSVKLRNSIN